MKFSFGGSAKKYWNQFENFTRQGGSGGELGKFTSSLKQGSEYLQKQGGGTIGEQLLHRPLREGETQTAWWKGLKNLDRSTMGWSRQASPLWEGGLTKPGGSTQDFLDWSEDVAMKSSHHLFGTDVGWADDASAATGSGAVTNSEAEDPSLINGGNWQRPGEIESALRREESMRKGTLYHDLAKTGRGRQEVKSLA